ncbi:hypothetical protein P175DRAFT_0504588 [Aspergillus ochraceoroseus IBT 24754]|uniref:Thiamine pyrophosphokinase n=1 Tax=Aspergillus ochraceoroseus IBT 24754 TaxID=1392256 RepID=A0A2T5LNG8_9EURO|nr:uncharacterized protein P175DRAFT_0504588 [Aspergillus ochraceoroseus IBT 24754]PTU17831.1 hypothetical protein P175DRAFT_0504588 [Aspergillus ochraceoroseus IBT 24754]
MSTHNREGSELPDVIIGDLDSVRPAVRTHYENLGVRVIEDEDQYSTDFTKSLRYLRSHAGEILSSSSSSSSSSPGTPNRLEILVMGGLGGRVDQAFSQIHHLYLMSSLYSSSSSSSSTAPAAATTTTTTQPQNHPVTGDLYLISEESITFILARGKNTIHTPRTNRGDLARPTPHEKQNENDPPPFLEENIGIVPLCGPARITTRGLQWDVENWSTEIGGQLSTSNHIRSERVEIESDVAVLFTLELAGRLKRVQNR